VTRLLAVMAAVLLATAQAGCVAPSSQVPPSSATSRPTGAEPQPTRTLQPVKVLGVLGDSISLGVNACARPGPCPERAWSGGDARGATTVATYLARATGTTPRTVMAATDGGDVSDAAARVGALASQRPDLVTILVGANDACAANTTEMVSVEDFRREFSKVLAVLDAEAPDGLVLAMSIPDLNRIWALGKDDPRAVKLWSGFWGCRNLLRDPNSSAPEVEASRHAVADRIVAFNEVIAHECRAASNCVTDGGELFRHTFTADEVSTIDFFHPSSAGQQAIAEVAWKALTSQVTLS
jgi:lysophospholipase L1-like esterase